MLQRHLAHLPTVHCYISTLCLVTFPDEDTRSGTPFHLHRCTFVEYVPHLVVHLFRQVVVPIRHRDVSVAQNFCQLLHLHTSVSHASCKRVPQVMKAHCRDTGLLTHSLPCLTQVHARACEYRLFGIVG